MQVGTSLILHRRRGSSGRSSRRQSCPLMKCPWAEYSCAEISQCYGEQNLSSCNPTFTIAVILRLTVLSLQSWLGLLRKGAPVFEECAVTCFGVRNCCGTSSCMQIFKNWKWNECQDFQTTMNRQYLCLQSGSSQIITSVAIPTFPEMGFRILDVMWQPFCDSSILRVFVTFTYLEMNSYSREWTLTRWQSKNVCVWVCKQCMICRNWVFLFFSSPGATKRWKEKSLLFYRLSLTRPTNLFYNCSTDSLNRHVCVAGHATTIIHSTGIHKQNYK